jgi:hypothetical protein
MPLLPPRRLQHKHFLRQAAEQKAVREALRFVQVLPRRYADSRTYNMVVSVAARAGDATAALQAADMFKSTGGKLDTILYTNLIAGWWPNLLIVLCCGLFVHLPALQLECKKTLYPTGCCHVGGPQSVFE